MYLIMLLLIHILNIFFILQLIGYDINKRMRLYKEAEMNQCYVETTNNIEFIKCIIETRRKLLAALNQNCSSM